jgi:tRNA nucleotidyltransferase/poly(A) polymerase
MTIDDETSTPTTPAATTEPAEAHASAATDAPAAPAPAHDDAPRVVDEAAWAEQNGDDEEDDEPLHFGAVADADVSAIDGEEASEDGDDEGDDEPASEDETASMAQRPDVEVTLNENAEIPLALIDEDALWVVKRLRAKGFEAYLTGGCVRDLLLGRTPKDFDVATAAHPNQVRAVFRNCRLVGRRFRLAHVFFPSGKVIETATFRANPTDTLDDVPEQDLLLSRDNVFGNVEEDARRRDLTINGLFYDPVAGKVLDFCDGRVDLEARLIRTIGDPEVRFQEDPVRILRAIKFATRLGFDIETRTWEAMCRHVGGLLRCAPARLQEEILRLLASTYASSSWALCVKAGVPQALLPEIWAALDLPGTATADEFDTATELASGPAAIAHIEAVEAHAVETHEPHAHAAHAAPVVADVSETVEAPVAVEGEAEAVETVVVAAAAPAPVAPSVATPADRHTRLVALLGAMDEIRKRDADITSALAFATLVTPLFEAWQGEPGRFEAWWSSTADILAERIRLTRHDKERVPQLLQAQADLEPHRRRGHHARTAVSRPSFRESLLLLILRLQAAKQPLDEVGAWKVVAAAHNQPYQQQRMDRNRQRAAGRGAGGNERGRGRGRDRDRDRDRGRGRNGGGGGGGGGRRRGR